ncbi:MAG: hypothetical protein WCG47_32055, partial [Dermatophilaceae bacterium]
MTGVCIFSVGDDAGGDDAGGNNGTNSGAGSADANNGTSLVQIDGESCRPAGLSVPQPLAGDPVWQGHTDGVIYDCVVGPRVGPGLFIAGSTIQY